MDFGIRSNLAQVLHQLLQVLLVGMTLGMMRTVVPALAESEFGVPRGSFMLLVAFVVARSWSWIVVATNLLGINQGLAWSMTQTAKPWRRAGGARACGRSSARSTGRPRCHPPTASRRRLGSGAVLMRYDWPGNIRELRNVLERARLFADDGEIRPEHLKLDAPVDPPVPPGSLDDTSLAAYVRGFKGSRKELAAALGMSGRTLYRRLKLIGEA